MEIDVGTRAILKLALLPPGSLLVLLLLGWLFARRVFGRLLLLCAIVALYCLSTPAGLGWLAAQVETIPAQSFTQLRAAEAGAILVPLAGTRRFNPELGGADALNALSLQRADFALALHRRTGLPIVFSGGSMHEDSPALADLAAAWLQDRAGLQPLAIENSSRDTWENARFSAGILQRREIDRVLLVTHAWHMPRALLSARSAGIDAIPAPFAFEHGRGDPQQPDEIGDWLPQPGLLGRSYLILHEMAGLIWYRFSH